MKLSNTIGIAVGALAGAVVLAAGLFIVFFPKDLAAREAERRIEEATGRELTLGDEISISFWPALGFSVNQASLSNPEGFSAEEPFIAADRIVFAVKVMPLLRGAVEVKELIFEGAEVRMQAKPDGATNWTFPTQETAEDQFTLEDLRLDDVRMIDGLISFQGAEGEPPLVLEDVDASLALQSLDTPARLDAAFDYRGERLDVDGTVGLPRAVLEKGETPMTAHLRSRPLNANFDGAFNAATGALAGRVDTYGDSVRHLLAWVGSPIGEGGGFGNYRLTAQMARVGETTALTDAIIRLDNIDARGALTLINQASGRLRIEGELNADRVDLNTYLPPPAQGGGEGGVRVGNSWSTAPLDLSGLRALDANLNLSLGALKFQRMDFSNVALALRIANGAADARLTRISFYDGGGTARLIADGSGSVPRIAVELAAQNVQAEPLLRDAIGFDRIAGRGRLTASLIGTGNSQAALMRNLRGNASFMFNDGQWKGVNLALVARGVQAAMSGQAIGPNSATDFAELGANFTVADGVMATDSLRLLNPFVRLDGRGLVNVGAQSIDMRLEPRAVNSAQGQGGDAAITGLGIPFRVTGPWSNVSFRPALEDVAQAQLRNVLSQQEAGSPLAALSEALFGPQANAPPPPPPDQAPAEQPAQADAQQPPQQQQPAEQQSAQQPVSSEERARQALQEALRRAMEGNREQEKQTEPAPAPSP
ncbi:MAG: AsmA family protein [Vitreimonas sp.]